MIRLHWDVWSLPMVNQTWSRGCRGCRQISRLFILRDTLHKYTHKTTLKSDLCIFFISPIRLLKRITILNNFLFFLPNLKWNCLYNESLKQDWNKHDTGRKVLHDFITQYFVWIYEHKTSHLHIKLMMWYLITFCMLF